MRKMLLTSAAALALAVGSAAVHAQTGSGTTLPPAGSSSNGAGSARSSESGGSAVQRPAEAPAGKAQSTEAAPSRSGTNAAKSANDEGAGPSQRPAARSAETPAPRSGSETRGTAQGEQSGKAAPSADNTDAGKSGSQRPARAEGQQPAQRSGAASSDQQNGRAPASAAQERTGTSSQSRSADTKDSSGELSTGSISAAAKLSGEQRTRVTATFMEQAKPVTNVNFSVSVGTRVTSEVRLTPVPDTIVSIVPQYRGYDYFVVRDEIVIVEPRTRKIVEVIHRSGGKGASLSIRQDKVGLIKRELKPRQTIRKEVTIEEGAIVPDDVELEVVPEMVITEVPEVRTYRYFRQGDEVVLVDPSSRRIVQVIE